MKYKELHSITYDDPNWDEVAKTFLDEWINKIKKDAWFYYDEENKEFSNQKQMYVAPKREFKTDNDKYNYLIQWELKNQKDKTAESPLNSLFCSDYKYDKYSNKHIYGIAEKMYDEFYKYCQESFVDINLPELFFKNDDDVYYHKKELKKIFDRGVGFENESKSRFAKIIENHFMLKDLYLLVKYQTPDKDDLTRNLTVRFDKLIVSGDLNVDAIETEAKKNYRASFIYLNINPEIRGTMFEDDSIVKIGKVFDEYYDYLAEEFCTDILELLEKKEKDGTLLNE